jgi:hypothetical protein
MFYGVKRNNNNNNNNNNNKEHHRTRDLVNHTDQSDECFLLAEQLHAAV